jgi:hypothetical protein
MTVSEYRIGLVFVEDNWSDPKYINKTIHRDIKVLNTTNINTVDKIKEKYGDTILCFDCYHYGEINSPQRIQFFDKDIDIIDDKYKLCRSFVEYVYDELDQNSEEYDDNSEYSGYISSDSGPDPDLTRLKSWRIIDNESDDEYFSDKEIQFGGTKTGDESSSYLNVDEYAIQVNNTYDFTKHCLVGIEDKIKNHRYDLMLVITTYFD